MPEDGNVAMKSMSGQLHSSYNRALPTVWFRAPWSHIPHIEIVNRSECPRRRKLAQALAR